MNSCATYGCNRPAIGTERRQTASMPAPGFYGYCEEHKPKPFQVVHAREWYWPGDGTRELRTFYYVSGWSLLLGPWSDRDMAQLEADARNSATAPATAL